MRDKFYGQGRDIVGRHEGQILIKRKLKYYDLLIL